jgi:Na+/H+-translocating membrane pyrophosphatase
LEAFFHNKLLQAWSLAAFFLGPCWAAYRKMYFYAVIWMMASIFLTLVIELRDSTDAIRWLSVIIEGAIAGFCGAKLYQIHARKTVEAASTNTSDDIGLARKGGTNLFAAFFLRSSK